MRTPFWTKDRTLVWINEEDADLVKSSGFDPVTGEKLFENYPVKRFETPRLPAWVRIKTFFQRWTPTLILHLIFWSLFAMLVINHVG